MPEMIHETIQLDDCDEAFSGIFLIRCADKGGEAQKAINKNGVNGENAVLSAT